MKRDGPIRTVPSDEMLALQYSFIVLCHVSNIFSRLTIQWYPDTSYPDYSCFWLIRTNLPAPREDPDK